MVYAIRGLGISGRVAVGMINKCKLERVRKDL